MGAIALGLLIAFYYLGPDIFEPRDNVRYEDATVIDRRSSRLGGIFIVRSDVSGHSWEVIEGREKFSSSYRGHAVLAISRGQWTGRTYVRLLDHKPPGDKT